MMPTPPFSTHTAAIFASGEAETEAIFAHLTEQGERQLPFRVGWFGTWQVVVLNLDNVNLTSSIRHDGSISYSTESLKGKEAVSAPLLLDFFKSSTSHDPDIILFLCIDRESDKDPKIHPGDIIINYTYYSNISDSKFQGELGLIEVNNICKAGSWKRRTNHKAPSQSKLINTPIIKDTIIPLGNSMRFVCMSPMSAEPRNAFFIHGIGGKSLEANDIAAQTAAAFTIEILSECAPRDILPTLHAALLALSPADFERASGAALSGILNIPFRQATSGRQLSGDIGGGTVRVEAKRYRTGTPGNRDLLGGLDTIARSVPDLSHWVIASTIELPLQAVDELRLAAQERLVLEVILDWPRTGIPPLAGALTLGRAEVGRQFPNLTPILDLLATRPEIIDAGEMVRAALRSEPKGRPIYNPALHYIRNNGKPREALDARFQAVPLLNRDAELEDWLNWARRRNRNASRLLTGEGGMGKTRLLIEVCDRLRAEGWRTGFLLEGVDGNALRRQLIGHAPLLIVIDYAERRAKDLEVLCEALRTINTKVLLALLARNQESRWREDLLASGGAAANFLDDEPGMEVLQLGPVAPTKPKQTLMDRLSVYAEARMAFQPGWTLDKSIFEAKTTPLPYDLRDSKYDRILLLLLEPWAEVFGATTGRHRSPVQAVLDREQHYLKPLAPAGITQRTMMEVLAWIYSHGGAPTRPKATKLLADCPALAGQPTAVISQFVDIFHDVYPGPHYLNPIQPDLIGQAVMERFGH